MRQRLLLFALTSAAVVPTARVVRRNERNKAMNKRTTIMLVTMLLCSLLLAGIAFTARASPAQDYEITWWTVDSGGGLSTSGDYALRGTIGQHDTGALTGGSYTLAGGCWGGGAVAPPPAQEEYSIFLPLVYRN